MDRDEELRLIERARGGDPNAIEGLVRRYQGSLHAFLLRRCGRPELAEDLVQESFVRVLRSLDRFDPRFRFSTWLFTIGRRLLVNHFQKMRPAYDSDIVEGRGGDAPPPADAVFERERRESILGLVEHAMDGLNPRQQRIVRMFHEQGLPIHEIARELDMPEGTIKSHLHRARRRMQDTIAADPVRHRRALEALGMEALGTEALGTEALGTEALGTEALGVEAVPVEASAAQRSNKNAPVKTRRGKASPDLDAARSGDA